jgi:hypothetical protein
MAQNINLNASPYFDDFDASNSYQRVLFKPGTPIQARELTTLQSILQDQVEQFGKHFFKEGSVVIPGQIAYDPDYFYVQIDANHLGVPVEIYLDALVGQTIKGQISGVKAKVVNYITSNTSERGNATLYVKYSTGSENDEGVNGNQKTVFDAGENLIVTQDVKYSLSTIRSESTFATTLLTDSVGEGSVAKIAEGVYFIRGFFVNVPAQEVILDQYGDTPSYRVGLFINEEITVASTENPDLFDNARGFSNFAAPGADRLKITTTLIKKSLDDLNDEDFIELLRIENGIVQKFVKDNPYNILNDELARRTYDESGHYYVTPFSIEVKESLNDQIGNDGVYLPNQQTQSGITPSDDFISLQISPGKAYVRGYEIETISTTSLDVPKARTTELKENSSIPFTLGRQFELNNVHGSLPVGFSTSTVSLRSERTASGGTAAGLEIGVARVYDLKLKNADYQNDATPFVVSLYDVQTYNYINLNSTIDLALPAYIEGKNSSAHGYLVEAVSGSNQLKLYQVSGTFIPNEQIKINGEDDSRTIKDVRDYSMNDVKQLHSSTAAFTADVLLNRGIAIAPQGDQFSITSGGVIKSPNQTFSVGIQTGDIVAYAQEGDTVPTFNKVTDVSASAKTITVDQITTVTGVCNGAKPGSTITVTNVLKLVPQEFNLNEAYLYAPLEEINVSDTNLSESNIVVRKAYDVTISGNGLNQTLETDNSMTLEPFDEEDYNLTYTSTGAIESLDNSKLTVNGRTITLQDLSVASGSARLTVTFKKKDLTPKSKVYNRNAVLIVDKSSKEGSGTATTSFQDGLTFGKIFGTRVQDKQISLNVPDVQDVLAVFESNDENEPELPKLTLTNFNANILNTIKGEYIRGETSGAVATVVVNNATNQVDFVYLNEQSFQVDEKVTFAESQVTANVSAISVGDRDILPNFSLVPNQKPQFCDYSFLERNSDSAPPTRKLKIIFNHYVLNADDPGDFVTVDSYEKQRYKSEIPILEDGVAGCDIIDVRPRVVPFDVATATRSPFEYNARAFAKATNSSPFNFVSDKAINLDYNFYLGRIDRVYLNKDGEFFLAEGVPSKEPKEPQVIDGSLDVGTITVPPYVFKTDDVEVVLTPHKRYRMIDISQLEDRLTTVENYTALSLLETETKNLTIRDSQTGLDRFKSGFFVDNFRSVFGGETAASDYRCSIDTLEGHLRPTHYTTAVDLLLGSEAVIGSSGTPDPAADLRFVQDLGTPNTIKKGDVICLNYDDVVYFANKFATRSENVNPFHVVNWIGAIELNPATDTWIETKKTKRTADIEGNYKTTMQQTGADSNTGLAPVEWGSWNTTWRGTQVTGRTRTRTRVDSRRIGRTTTRGPRRSRGRLETTRTTRRDTFIQFTNTTTLTTRRQQRTGTQLKVTERFDSTNLGDRVVSTEVIHTMRSRNIEFIARRMKPNGRVYPFFDNVDMSKYVIPKLIEIEMISGTFQVGEVLVGNSGAVSVRVRVAKADHKYGPYNAPSQTYKQNPYKTGEILPKAYSTTSSVLNIDTAGLELQSASGYYGYIVKDMKLVGQSSGGVAKIKDIRLKADNSGTIIGSLFLPDPTLSSTPSFSTGTKTFSLTSSKTKSTIVGTKDSEAETTYSASGTLQNVENLTLRMRNADVERNTQTQGRTRTSSRTRQRARTTFRDRTTVQRRWVDPLAQSFEVPDTNGIFISKVDFFFRTVDTAGLPVTCQIRTMQTGLPTQTIVPFGETVLTPDQVSVSNDSSVPTTFEFPSPVYLAPNQAYCFVLLSASNEYNVWISRMGEVDVSTLDKAESEQIIVAQQPLLGSLFKSQNGATWDPAQYEDLKLTAYRAEFFEGSSTARFYNPDLDIGNNQIASLDLNPLETTSKSILVGIAKSLSTAETGALTPGVKVLQQSNPGFSGNLRSLVGAIGISSDLTITNAGTAFTSASTTYANVDLISLTGKGSGAKATVTVNGGVAVAATVSIGGTGYAFGDSLTVDYADTGNFGKNLILSIPNTVGVISAFNSLIIDRVQGNIAVDGSSTLFYVGTGGTANISGASNVKYAETLSDGLHLKVRHSNHGMYSVNNFVTLSGIQPDQKPSKIEAKYTPSSTGDLVVENVGIFTSFENVPVDNTNPGYIIIDDEIIKYTGVNTAANSLQGISRAQDNTISEEHSINEPVYKYEMNGVSLRRINKKHDFSEVNHSLFPIDMDSYHIKIDASKSGTDRTTGNANSFPVLFFNEDKKCGSYDQLSLKNSNRTPHATQNIPFNALTPNLQTAIPEGTTVSAKVRTFSGGSPDNLTQLSFNDQGFEPISLESTNFFETPRIICSKVNEDEHLQDFPGKKSFTIEVALETTDPKVSPMIDLDRVNAILTTNRINSKITDFSTDGRVNSLTEDPSAATYVTKIIKLEKGSDNLKVFFDAYRHSSNDIRVLYRLFRTDTDESNQSYELFPGYKNLDANGNVVSTSDNDGLPDKIVDFSNTDDDFRSYEYTAKNLPLFNGFQVKIVMNGTNLAKVPLIRDLRVIATA